MKLLTIIPLIHHWQFTLIIHALQEIISQQTGRGEIRIVKPGHLAAVVL
jgi:hypothetical protein